MQDHFAWALESFQRADRAHQFHAVVGGMRFAAAQLALLAHGAQQCAPAADAGVALAGTIGKNFNCVKTGRSPSV